MNAAGVKTDMFNVLGDDVPLIKLSTHLLGSLQHV